MPCRRWRSVATAIVLVMLTLAPAAPADARPATDSIETIELRGTIGHYAVGANLAIRNKDEFVAGHYFYASHLRDIPLQGRMNGPDLTLQEPGGGVFRLHLVGNPASTGQPADVAHATGLQGDWRDGDKALPVLLQFDSSYPGLRTRWYEDVTGQSDAAFEAMVQRFIHAVLAGNRDEAARAVSYPLRVNGRTPRLIHDKAALLAHWDQIFTPQCIVWLRDTIPHEMFVHDGQAMVGGGLVWFDAHGASAVNVP